MFIYNLSTIKLCDIYQIFLNLKLDNKNYFNKIYNN